MFPTHRKKSPLYSNTDIKNSTNLKKYIIITLEAVKLNMYLQFDKFTFY